MIRIFIACPASFSEVADPILAGSLCANNAAKSVFNDRRWEKNGVEYALASVEVTETMLENLQSALHGAGLVVSKWVLGEETEPPTVDPDHLTLLAGVSSGFSLELLGLKPLQHQ